MNIDEPCLQLMHGIPKLMHYDALICIAVFYGSKVKKHVGWLYRQSWFHVGAIQTSSTCSSEDSEEKWALSTNQSKPFATRCSTQYHGPHIFEYVQFNSNCDILWLISRLQPPFPGKKHRLDQVCRGAQRECRWWYCGGTWLYYLMYKFKKCIHIIYMYI